MCVKIYVCVCVCVKIYVCVCKDICVCVRAYVRVCVHTCVCVCDLICISPEQARKPILSVQSITKLSIKMHFKRNLVF